MTPDLRVSLLKYGKDNAKKTGLGAETGIFPLAAGDFAPSFAIIIELSALKTRCYKVSCNHPVNLIVIVYDKAKKPWHRNSLCNFITSAFRWVQREYTQPALAPISPYHHACSTHNPSHG
ncbi:MAG: hypothetical protein HYU70_01910 [Bacteroidetes bacterium]|nr:hypothetical protein [Bacteroidota bacterium]